MWKYEINWNGKLTAKGWSTAAFLSEMIWSAAIGNFPGLPASMPDGVYRRFKVGMQGAWPTLDSLLAMEAYGKPLEGYCEDETGRFSWSVIRIAGVGA